MARPTDSEETRRLKQREKIGEETAFEEVKETNSAEKNNGTNVVEPNEPVENDTPPVTNTTPTGTATSSAPEFTEMEVPMPNLGGDPDGGAQKTYNPLAGDSKAAQRAYTQNTGAPKVELVKEAFTPPNINNIADQPKPNEPVAPPPPVNPEIANLSETDQRKAAERMFDAGVTAYKMLLDLAEKGVKIKDTKINELIKNDELNLYVPVTFEGEGDSVEVIPFACKILYQLNTFFISEGYTLS